MSKLIDRRVKDRRAPVSKHVFEVPGNGSGVIKLYKRIVNRRSLVSSNIRVNKKDRRKENNK